MEERTERPASSLYTSSTTYTAAAFRNPVYSQESEHDPVSPEQSPPRNTPRIIEPEQFSHPLRHKPTPIVSIGAEYQQLSLGDHPEADDHTLRPQPFSHNSFSSIQSNDPLLTPGSQRSGDYLLSNPRESGRLNGPPLPPYGQDTHLIEPWERWRWLNSSWTMYGLLIIGIAGAISHHAFYAHLDRQPVYNQLMQLRYGAALAYVTKASLMAAVVFAYRQQLWATCRRKNLRMTTIDSLFAATEDLSALANLDLPRVAKSVLALSIMVWLFPLTVILTPATLTVAPLQDTNHTMCSSVRTLNFDMEKPKNWRLPVKINNYPLVALSLWNSTLNSTGQIKTPFNETFLDYYTAPTRQLDSASTLSALLKKVVPRENASVETCGAGWNCTYTISFIAPGYKCEQIAEGRNDNTDKLADMNAPFNTNDLIPDGNCSYIAQSFLGEYSNIQIDAVPGGAPKVVGPLPKNLGTFRTEPVLWVGHSDRIDPNTPLPSSSADPAWNSSYMPKIFRCEHYVTNYTVRFNHTLASQGTTIVNKTYLYPIINTTYVPNQDANDGTKDNTTATPESNYIYPLDTERYRLTAAYHSVGLVFREYMNGTMSYNGGAVANTDALKTRLINPTNYLVIDNYITELQKFYEDIILSLFSYPQFLIVTWAGAPNTSSGIANATDPKLLWPCTKTRITNKFVYRARDLWITYSLAILCATVGVAFGAAALAQNNHHVRSTRFSSIVAATRAPVLEDLPWKHSKWGEVPLSVYDATLGYGLVVDESPRASPMGESPPMEQGEGRPPQTPGGREYWGFAPVERLTQGTELRGQNYRARGSVLSFKTY
ncbi:hypothetical protein BT63DRAFT_222969 [Microthyrium microscopicum]|uniref:Formylmethionine deformylase-like protein n=1 Tax=Microthyrium microscopicum TaxID=703497 RepID=A0A6A6UDA8_9PEZI|nr:hypothetical protein BT63DRAFT_222969 [Microthyrium microscopicum]